MTAALLAASWLRRPAIHSFWPYVVGPGSLSWAALYFGGFHPALALVPIVPFMPHAPHDFGLFDSRETLRENTLDRFEHWWARPVQLVLLFGFANAGVPFAQIGHGTYYVLAALLLGKPLGIVLFSAGARMMGARLPAVSGPRSAAGRDRRIHRVHRLAVLRDRRPFPRVPLWRRRR